MAEQKPCAQEQEGNGGPAQIQQSGLRGERSRSGMSEPCGGEGYAPASFEKRAAAWMGVAYMVMLIFIFNFAIYTGGRQLPGTFPLFLVPVCVTLAVVILRRLKSRALPGGLAGGVLALACCAAGAVLGLALGAPALIAAFQG